MKGLTINPEDQHIVDKFGEDYEITNPFIISEIRCLVLSLIQKDYPEDVITKIQFLLKYGLTTPEFDGTDYSMRVTSLGERVGVNLGFIHEEEDA